MIFIRWTFLFRSMRRNISTEKMSMLRFILFSLHSRRTNPSMHWFDVPASHLYRTSYFQVSDIIVCFEMASVHFIELLAASDSKFRPEKKNFEFISRTQNHIKITTHPNTSNGWYFKVCIRVCVVHHFRSIFLSSLFS